MEYRARMMPVFGGVILLFLCASGDSVVTETALSGVDRRHGGQKTGLQAWDSSWLCLSRCGRGRWSAGVLGQPSLLHHGSRSLCPHASLLPGESHYHPLLLYINTLGLQTNPHCSEISRGGRTVPLSEAERGREDGWEGGRREGGRGSGVALQIPTKDNET